MKKTIVIISAVMVVLLAACSTANTETQQNDGVSAVPTNHSTGGSSSERTKYSFEELVEHSDAALYGTYMEMLVNDNTVDYAFSVNRFLYGATDDEIIYVRADIGDSTAGDYEYKTGGNIYEAGREYLLITERHESIFYEHDIYVIAADVLICEETATRVLYGEDISVPKRVSLDEYIISLKKPEDKQEAVRYGDSFEEMCAESKFIGEIQILSLYNENESWNVYLCKAGKLLKGEEYKLNTYEDGTMLMSLAKDTVTEGGAYLIGFSPVSENSCIYIQTNLDSVLEISAEIYTAVENAVENK
ncbi:MAG: hypothetical protein IJU78_07460 [Clostridia bacterium]|nr:hypothetical protein [Clostridia bacterium]